VYGCPKKTLENGQTIEFSKFPGDSANGKRPYIKTRKDIPNGGSGQDWYSMIFDVPHPWYVIDVDGTVAEVSYFTMVNPRIHKWAPSTAGRCAWVR